MYILAYWLAQATVMMLGSLIAGAELSPNECQGGWCRFTCSVGHSDETGEYYAHVRWIFVIVACALGNYLCTCTCSGNDLYVLACFCRLPILWQALSSQWIQLSNQ